MQRAGPRLAACVARAFASVSSQAALEVHVWLGAHGGDVLTCDGVARHLGGSAPAAAVRAIRLGEAARCAIARLRTRRLPWFAGL